MMPQWKVEMEAIAETQLKADFQSGVITAEDIKVIKRWVGEVEDNGLEYAQANFNWRDHDLDHVDAPQIRSLQGGVRRCQV
jgi:hypothetical protein